MKIKAYADSLFVTPLRDGHPPKMDTWSWSPPLFSIFLQLSIRQAPPWNGHLELVRTIL